MRYLKKSNLVVLIFALIVSFLITGCYTQFSRPRIETEEDYYTTDENEQPIEDYDEYEPYYEDQEDSVIVNNNYYDVYNYGVPYYNDYYYGAFGYPYNYDPYDLYYTGYYPNSWWNPYYHWRNPAGMLDIGTLITIGILRDIIRIITVMEEDIITPRRKIEEILSEGRAVWQIEGLEIINSLHLLIEQHEILDALNAVKQGQFAMKLLTKERVRILIAKTVRPTLSDVYNTLKNKRQIVIEI